MSTSVRSLRPWGLTALGTACLLAFASAPAVAQDAPGCFVRGDASGAAERPSPLDSATVTLGGDEAKLCYGAPSARGRTIMGGLVPYDTPWRMGANEATALHLTFPATVAGVSVEPGSYSLYAVPGEDEWVIAVNAEAERWGVPITGEIREADVGRGTVTPGSTDEMVEQLTYRFEEMGEDEAHLVMEWENTRVRIPVVKTGM